MAEKLTRTNVLTERVGTPNANENIVGNLLLLRRSAPKAATARRASPGHVWRQLLLSAERTARKGQPDYARESVHFATEKVTHVLHMVTTRSIGLGASLRETDKNIRSRKSYDIIL